MPSDQLHMLLAAPWTGFFLHLMEEPSVGAQVVGEVLRYTIPVIAHSMGISLLFTSNLENGGASSPIFSN